MAMNVQQLFESLERQKEAFLSEISNWPPPALRFRPAQLEWSCLDVLDHLVKVEKAFLDFVKGNLPNGRSVPMTDRIRARVVIYVMRSPIRVKTPASVSMVLPGSNLDPSQLKQNWNEVRKNISNLLRALDPPQLRIGLFQHPVGGWMPVPQAMEFLSAHLRHHGYQLKRLKSLTRGLA